MMQDSDIHLNRLILKRVTPLDLHQLFKTCTKEEIKFRFGVDNTGYENYKVMHEKGMETDRISLLFFLLIDRARNITMGECGFHTWNRFHDRAEIFYHLRDDSFKRQGFMSEALPCVIHYGFTEMNLNRIQAMIASSNTPSLNLLLKNGFSKEGTSREDYLINGVYENSECYSLLKREWVQQQVKKQ